MDSLGADSMFDEDEAYLRQDVEASTEQLSKVFIEPSSEDKLWQSHVYEGGRASDAREEGGDAWQWWMKYDDEPANWRVQLVSAVTNSSLNSTAIDIVNTIYDYIKNGTNNDPRINYQIISYSFDNGDSFGELDNMIQMWLESYNCYHLIDGAAMKDVWGAIMPHIIYSPKNLEAILDQVQWALAEDAMSGAMLSPRMRRIRVRGGASEMTTGLSPCYATSLSLIDRVYTSFSLRC
jgi:hypothetical protein